MRMTGTRRLVEDVVSTLPKPYGEDVIDEAYHAIEHRPDWRRRYDELVRTLGKAVVDARVQFWIADCVGRAAGSTARAAKTTLVARYVKLAGRREKRGRKLKEPEALKVMSQYYQAHRAGLPETIASQREVIVEMLMEGYSAEEAFAQAR